MSNNFKVIDFLSGDFFLVNAKIFFKIKNNSYRNLYISLLSFRNNKTNNCYPSYSKLEEVANLSRPTIAKGLRFLINNNFLRKKEKKVNNGYVNIYYFINPLKTSITGGPQLPPDRFVHPISNYTSEGETGEKSTSGPGRPTPPVSSKKQKAFIPPTLEEVKGYIREQNLSVEADIFFKYFTNSGWVDSNGKKVRNWKNKLLTWHSHRKEKKNNITTPSFDELTELAPYKADKNNGKDK